MKLDFDAMEETAIPRFRDGEKTTYARMFVDGNNRIMRGRLEPGASIGLHPHQGSSEIVYILSGTGMAAEKGTTKRRRASQMRAAVFLPVSGLSPPSRRELRRSGRRAG